MDLTIELDLSDTKGSFIAKHDGTQVGEMTLSRAGAHLVIIDHTDVDEASKGQGVGEAIFLHMVDWARSGEIKVIPLCPFTARMFSKHPEARDVVSG